MELADGRKTGVGHFQSKMDRKKIKTSIFVSKDMMGKVTVLDRAQPVLPGAVYSYEVP